MNDDELRQLFPEQMTRDSSGQLARATLAALTASNDPGTQPTLTYLHGDRRCGGTLAVIGATPAGTLYVAPRHGYRPATTGALAVPDEHPAAQLLGDGLTAESTTVVETGVTTTRYFASEGTATRNRRGWTFPDGYVALVVEPLGFPPAPAELPAQCDRCDRSTTITRRRILDDIEHGEPVVRVGIPAR